MASAAHICGVCDLRHVTKLTVSWCPDCDEGFCSGCEEHHSLAKATRHHQTMPIAEYQKLPPDVMQIPLSCTKHDEKFLLYCRDHETPCCGKCVNDGHKKCQEVVDLDDIIKHAKTSSSFEEVEDTLSEVVDNMQKVRKFHQENLRTILENRKSIENEIQKIRLKMNNHLDQIQKKSINEVRTSEENMSLEIKQKMKILDEKEQYFTTYRKKINNIKHHASNFQAFMARKQLETKISAEDAFLKSYDESERSKSIVLNIDAAVENIMTNLKRFGEIVVETKLCDLSLACKKKAQAQMIIPKVQTKSIYDTELKLQQKISTSLTNIRGCCQLPDGRMVLSCFTTKTVIFLKTDGSEDFVVGLPSAVAVAHVKSENAIAVTSYLPDNCIQVIDIAGKKVKKSISLNTVNMNFGIAERQSMLFFCSETSGLKMLNLTDNSVTDISYENIPAFSYVDTFDDNLFYTNFEKNTVTCCNIKGRVKWTFKDTTILKTPFGIAVDNSGNIFVIGGDSCNVVVIEPNGQNCRELLSAKDGLKSPQSLYCERRTNTLLVANGKDNVFKYTIV
ncbi:uncharacterized protein LOC127706808 [Mytilus californianus]|uniref:uncharacterized protein LOC127706808 n=1 Tax=Mytilus californianus TaxID=6549 RepID=UPI002246830D|nr:uncharacterized protein LOC127706808 [Mytilus californianus]